jgi:hypothetical protein
MTLGHSRINVATKMEEKQGCPGLAVKAGPAEQSLWSNNHWGPGPNKASILGQVLGGKAPGLIKTSQMGLDMGALHGGCPHGVQSPCGLGPISMCGKTPQGQFWPS